MVLTKDQLFKRNDDYINSHFNTKDDWKYVPSENLILDMNLQQFHDTFMSPTGIFNMKLYMDAVPDFYDVEDAVWNEAKTQCKMDFKIHIDGVPYYNSTTGDAEFWIDSWDQTPGGYMVIQSVAVTYDLPYYSRMFKLHEATVLMENPDNVQQIVFKKLLWIEWLEYTYLEWPLTYMFQLNFGKNAQVWVDYVFKHGLNNIPLPPPPKVELPKPVEQPKLPEHVEQPKLPEPVEQPKLPEQPKAVVETPSAPKVEEQSVPIVPKEIKQPIIEVKEQHENPEKTFGLDIATPAAAKLENLPSHVNYTHVEDHSSTVVNQNFIVPQKAMAFYHPTQSTKKRVIDNSAPFYMYLLPIFIIWICFYRRSLKKAKLQANKENEAKKMQDECLIDELSKQDLENELGDFENKEDIVKDGEAKIRKNAL